MERKPLCRASPEGFETGTSFPKGLFQARFDTISNSNAEWKRRSVENQERNHFLTRKRTWGKKKSHEAM